MQDSLHYGDIITLYCEPSAMGGMGYMCSLTSEQSRCLVRHSAEKVNPPIRNILACQFMIMAPARENRAQDDDDDKDDIARKAAGAGGAEDGGEDDAGAEEEHIGDEGAVEGSGDKKDELHEQNRLRGRPVLYGQTLQLRNMFTRGFVRSRLSRTAALDHTNMAVGMSKNSSRDCTFRILPRYRVRSEGEHVRELDQVILENISGGNFLHCGMRRFDEGSVEAGHYEIDLSVVKSAFIVSRFTPHPEALPKNALTFGTTVRLFYKERDAYLAAEGSSRPATVVEDLHFRMRVKPKHPTGPSYFFRIESAENIISGGVVRKTSLVRIRHLPTLTCISVAPDNTPTLTDASMGPDSVFRLIGEDDDTTYIQRDSFVKLYHVATRRCICISEERTEYVKRVYQELPRGPDAGLLGLLWDKAELVQAELTRNESRTADCAFELTPVPDSLMAPHDYVSGLQPYVSFMRERIFNKKISHREVKEFAAQMHFLAHFELLHGEGHKPHQKVLRHLMVVDELVYILHLLHTTPIPNARDADIRAIMRAVYGVLDGYVNGDSRKNELYIARHFELFLKQVPLGVDSEKMLVNLVGDNFGLLSNLSAAQIDLFMDLLRKHPSPQYLDFLRILCFCDNKPLTDNQNLVVASLLGGGDNILCETFTFEDPEERNAPGIMVILPDKTRIKLKDLSRHLAVSGERKGLGRVGSVAAPHRMHAELLAKQLELYGVLCAGRNTGALEIVRKKVTWQQAMLGMSSESVHPRLRTAYASLLLRVYVDVEPHVPDMDTIDLNFRNDDLKENVDKAADDDDTKASTDTSFPEFPELKAYIATYLQRHITLTASNGDENLLTMGMLRIARYCSRFGYYTSARNVDQLVALVIQVLRCDNDRETQDTGAGGPGTMKTLARTDRREVVIDEPAPAFDWTTGKPAPYNSVKIEGLRVLNVLNNLRLRRRLFSAMFLYKQKKGAFILSRLMGTTSKLTSVGTLEEDLRAITNLIRTEQLDHDNILSGVLQQLASFNNPQVRLLSLQLLDRQFSAYDEIFTCLHRSQVLVTKDTIERHSKALSRHKLSEFRLCLGKDLNKTETEFVVGFLRDLSGFCVLSQVYQESPEIDVVEPHRANQDMLYNAGIFEDLISLVQRTVNLGSRNAADQAQVCIEAFTLMRLMMLENNDIQKRAFERVDFLLTLPEYRTPPRSLGREAELLAAQITASKGTAIAEIFTSARELCFKVSEATIEGVIRHCANDRVKSPALLGALDAIIMVEELNLPLKRNQNFIMKYVPKYRRDFFLLCEQDDNDRRLTLLESILVTPATAWDTTVENSDLAYHLKLVDLLATMCQGENRNVEGMCQTIFSLQSVLQILAADHIAFVCKMPYLRFLLWVYINCSRSKIEIGTTYLHRDPMLWRFIQRSIHPFLTERLRTVDLGVAAAARRAFDSTNLYYMFAGVVPFLQFFLDLFYQPNEASKDQAALLQTIGYAVMRIVDYWPNIVRDNLQGPAAMRLVSRIAIAVGDDGLASAVEKRRELDQVRNPMGLSRLRLRYNQEYVIHHEYNRIVRQWAGKLRGLYETPYNTSKVVREHESKVLPDSLEFSDLLGIFVSYQGNAAKTGGAPNPIVGLDKMRLLVTQFSEALESASDTSVAESDRVSYQALCIKAIHLFRAVFRHERSRVYHVPRDKLSKYRPMIWKDIAALQARLVDLGVLDAIVTAFRLDNMEVHAHCMRLMNDLLENDSVYVQQYMNDHFRRLGMERLFLELQARLALATNSVKERKMIAVVLRNDPNPNREVIDEIIKFKDEYFSKLALRVLDRMCGGEFRPNQQLIVRQASRVSVNLLTDSLSFLVALHKNTDEASLAMVLVVLQTLREAVQGHIPNQRELLDRKIIDPINHIFMLLHHDTSNMQQETMLALVSAAVNLLLVMLEYTTDASREIAVQIYDHLDLQELVRNLDACWDHSLTPRRDAALQRELSLQFYTVLMRLRDLTGHACIPRDIFGEGSLELQGSRFADCQAAMASVEILRDGELQRVHFSRPTNMVVQEEMKEHLLYRIERDQGPIGKVKSLVELSEFVVAKMERRRRLLQHRSFSFILRHSDLWWYLGLFLTGILNLLMLIAFESSRRFSEFSPERPFWYDPALYFFGIMHIVCSALLVSEYFLTESLIKSKPMFEVARAKKKESIFSRLFRIRARLTPSSNTLYHIIYFGLSVIGVAFYGYPYCFHILHFARRNRILSDVFLAISSAGAQLGWVALLLLFIMYNYTLFSFAYLRRSLIAQNGQFCNSMGQCLLTIVSFGLRNGGGIGDVMEYVGISPHEASFRVPFDLTFWVLITVVGLNIVFTVIVGNFAKRREDQAEIDEDLKRNCLICSQASYDFEVHAKGFKTHTKYEHNILSYIYFFVYLRDKVEREENLTSHEDAVVAALRHSNMGFFPLGRALGLNMSDNSEVDDRIKTLEHLVRGMATSARRVRRQQQEIDDRKLVEEREAQIYRGRI